MAFEIGLLVCVIFAFDYVYCLPTVYAWVIKPVDDVLPAYGDEV